MQCRHGPRHQVPSPSSTPLWCSVLPIRRWMPRALTGRVEHLVSGHVMEFQSVEALFTFMAAQLHEVQQLSTAGHTAESHLQD
jgi:hypothetical protein